jgi:hypothetical protein
MLKRGNANNTLATGGQQIDLPVILDEIHSEGVRGTRSCPLEHDVGGCPRICRCQCPSCKSERRKQNPSSPATKTRVLDAELVPRLGGLEKSKSVASLRKMSYAQLSEVWSEFCWDLHKRGWGLSRGAMTVWLVTNYRGRADKVLRRRLWYSRTLLNPDDLPPGPTQASYLARRVRILERELKSKQKLIQRLTTLNSRTGLELRTTPNSGES